MKIVFRPFIFFCAVSSFSLSAAHADQDVIDQQQLTFNGMADAFGQQDPMAQIFTAGITGSLDKISIQAAPCYDAWNKPCSFNIQIQTVDGNGNPSGVVIGQGRGREPQPPSNGNAFGWADVTLSSPAKIQAGSRYAMVLRADWWMQVTLEQEQVLMGKQGIGTTTPGGRYGNQANLVFKTWVVPALPSQPFQSVIYSATNNKCLIFGGNGYNIYPERYLWGAGTNPVNCGFDNKQDLINNRQAIWKFTQIQGNKYTISNSSRGLEECLIFGGNGNNAYPERYLWGSGTNPSNCGFSTQQELLDNKQAIWIVDKVGENQYTIRNESKGIAQCLIFGGNGNNTYPERYLWGTGTNPTNCGFNTQQELLDNKQAIWNIQPFQ